MRKVVLLISLAAVGVLLFYTVGKMPPMNSPDTPDKTHVVPRYLEKGYEEGGAGDIVTGIILNYRGYDTSLEVTVIFGAVCASLAILDLEKRRRSRSGVDASGVPPSVIMRTVVRFCVPVIILFAVYIITHGLPNPGGGFQGGAVIGGSVIVFTLIFGLPVSTDRMSHKARLPLETTDILCFLLVGVIGIFFGVEFLTYVLPGVHGAMIWTIRTTMLNFIQVGIGLSVGIAFTSIALAMIREDEYELPDDSAQH